MADKALPKYSPRILALMEQEDEMITAADIAPIIHMDKDVIIKRAKKGKWDREICNYIVSGEDPEAPGAHVKFFRIDFLRKGSWIT